MSGRHIRRAVTLTRAATTSSQDAIDGFDTKKNPSMAFAHLYRVATYLATAGCVALLASCCCASFVEVAAEVLFRVISWPNDSVTSAG